MTRICSVPGCGKPHYGRGLCDLHREPLGQNALKSEDWNKIRTKHYEIFG